MPQLSVVDWTRSGEDGLLSVESKDVTNWYGSKARIYAAAAGTVALFATAVRTDQHWCDTVCGD